MRSRVRTLGVLVGSLWLGCTSSQEAKSPPDQVDDEPEPVTARPSGGPAIESEIGALDENAVKDTFGQARAKVVKCLRGANEGLDLPVVGGELEIEVRVKSDGSVRWVLPTRSTLGHRGAEQCVASVLTSLAWPRPEDGDEGIARTDYGIDPPGRAPVAWSPDDLGSHRAKVKAELAACKQAAGTSALSVTLYVDADGKVISAGGAAGDEHGGDAIDCGVAAVKGMTFPSPGSYPAKVTVRAP